MEIDAVRRLFTVYAEEQGFKLCFQGFDRELAGLPGDYAPPAGCILLAQRDGAAVGTAAVKPAGAGSAELKRLFILPEARGLGIGRRLAERAIGFARGQGYRQTILETLDSMSQARTLYAALGFRSVGRDTAGIERFALDF